LFAAGGKDGEIKLYEVKSGESAAVFSTDGALHDLSCSENGTWIASASANSTSVSIWDLRKLAMIKSLDIGSTVNGVEWDYTGQFLAVAGDGCVAVEQYSKSSKKWSEPFRKAVPATDIVWGASAQSLTLLDSDGGLVNLA
jgi:pre-mRNA-processing factor 19